MGVVSIDDNARSSQVRIWRAAKFRNLSQKERFLLSRIFIIHFRDSKQAPLLHSIPCKHLLRRFLRRNSSGNIIVQILLSLLRNTQPFQPLIRNRLSNPFFTLQSIHHNLPYTKIAGPKDPLFLNNSMVEYMRLELMTSSMPLKRSSQLS